ncbi:hypothetical protein G443_001190 [Actinoalloteichus cyanogriseus DSM 43889]|uniref:Uncharacterized protein n=1 Tax=Actinoalloteichus caeruleus DSM 43889 TaxID=1120930 RepID=A0ABT1JEK7_ACTCY|nr:hypothetical protein [Actinoalloteichus caeruleus DSM 43889]
MTGRVGRCHHDPQHEGTVEHQRGEAGQFGHLGVADLVAHPQGQVDQGRAGHHGPAQHPVVGQPRRRVGAQPPGEQHLVRAGDVDDTAEQGVPGGADAQTRAVGARPGGGEPVVAPVERVAGQVERPGVLEELPPGHRDPGDVQVGQRAEQGFGLVVVPAERGDGRDRVAEDETGEAGEGGVRPEFEHGGDAEAGQGGDQVTEQDGGPGVLDPVVGVGPPFGGPSGHVGQPGEARFVEGDAVEGGAEVRQRWFHQRGVEGVGDPEPGRADAARGGGADGGVDRVRRAGDHHGLGAVDGGDLHPVDAQRLGGSAVGVEGGHRAAVGQGVHQPGPGRHHPAGVGQVPHPRHVGGRQLPHGMTGHHLRPDPPRGHHRVQRGLHREQRGLGVAGAVEARGVGGAGLAEDEVADGEPELRFQGGADLVEGGGEGRVGGVEPPAQAGPLGALPAEEDRQPPGAGGAGGGDLGEAGQQVGAVPPEHHRPVVEAGAGGGQRVAEVGGLGAVAQHLGDVPCLDRHRLGGAGREHQGCERAAHPAGCRVRWRGRRLFEDDVGVGAADPEGGHGGPPGPVVLGPRGVLGGEGDRAGGPVDVAGGPVDVEGAGQHAPTQGQGGPQDAGDAGGGLGVAEVRLDRPQQQRGVPPLPVGREQGLRLDRVAEGGTGAVGLDRVDVGGFQPGGGQRGADHALLGRPVGGGQPVGRAVGVHGGGTDHGEDAAAVAERVGEPFHEQQPGALGPGGAVGGVGEGLAAPVGGEAALPGELDEEVRGGEDGGAADEGEAALPRPQGPGGQVQGDQGGGAGGVDREGGAFEAERVGQAPGGDAGGVPGEQVALDLGDPVAGVAVVVLPGHADEHPGGGAAQRPGVDAGVFDGAPRGFQQDPLLGVHGQRLAG